MDRLYRSRQDRMLAGVAGGLAELWDADPSLIRVIWALLVVFTGGIALVVYIVMAIIVPDEIDVRPLGAAGVPGGAPAAGPDGSPAAPGGPAATADPAAPSGPGWTTPGADLRAARREARAARRAAGRDSPFPGAMVAGGILIILGGFFLAREFLPSIDFDFVWPFAIIGVGALLIVTAVRRPGDSGS
jgi:phage shock protein PspC (stress-responsive transcriptional regulator)